MEQRNQRSIFPGELILEKPGFPNTLPSYGNLVSYKGKSINQLTGKKKTLSHGACLIVQKLQDWFMQVSRIRDFIEQYVRRCVYL